MALRWAGHAAAGHPYAATDPRWVADPAGAMRQGSVELRHILAPVICQRAAACTLVHAEMLSSTIPRYVLSLAQLPGLRILRLCHNTPGNAEPVRGLGELPQLSSLRLQGIQPWNGVPDSLTSLGLDCDYHYRRQP